jgi:phosphatidate cytidylyltransferase
VITHRIVSTIVLATLAVLAIFYDIPFILVIVIFTFGGLYEFFSLVEKKGVPVYKYFGTVVGLIIPLSIFYKFELTKGWELLFIVVGLISLFMLQIVKKDTSQALFSISVTIFGILYIAWLFSFMIKIRFLPYGKALLGALIFITKVSDIGAYLIGTRFGRHPFITKISPKKTIEGTIGGVLFGIFAALACNSFLPDIKVFSYVNLIFVGFILGIIALLGDLSESLIKRDCIAKDSSGVFPGIGGVMDLIDSLLFTAPVFYFYIYRFFA